tara:strand:+ start:4787 stop:5677 length:891 start_codon:yes stop_codon:yes gene_type:complete
MEYINAQFEALAEQLGCSPCGLNADWNSQAWHLSKGAAPNTRSGDFYLLDCEDGTFHVCRSMFEEDSGEEWTLHVEAFSSFREGLLLGMDIAYLHAYDTPLKTQASAELFIRKLWQSGKGFHLDDDPKDIIDEQGRPIFSAFEARHLRDRQDELFALLDDPHEAALACQAGENWWQLQKEYDSWLEENIPLAQREDRNFELTAENIILHTPEWEEGFCEKGEKLPFYVNALQRRWLSDFIERWEALEEDWPWHKYLDGKRVVRSAWCDDRKSFVGQLIKAKDIEKHYSLTALEEEA